MSAKIEKAALGVYPSEGLAQLLLGKEKRRLVKRMHPNAKNGDRTFTKNKKNTVSEFMMVWFLFFKLYLLILSAWNGILNH